MSHTAVPPLATHLHAYHFIPPRNLFMKHNQTRSRVGDPLYSALPHRSAQRILSPRSGCAFGSRCAETPGGNAARTFFFFLLAINLEEKSASCIPQGDRKGGSSPSAAPLVPLTPFFYSLSFTSPLSSALCLQLT